MASSFANISIRFLADLKEFSTQMENVKKQIEKTGKDLAKVGADLSKSVSLPIAALGAAVLKVSTDTAEFASKIGDSSQAAGMNAESFQKMDYALKQYGISSADVTSSQGRLNQRIGLAIEGNKKYADGFRNLGVAIQDVKGNARDTDTVFLDVANALSKIEDPSTRSAKASQIFGVNLSRRLLPALSEGREGIEKFMQKARELGLIMSNEEVKAAEEYDTAIQNLRLQFSAIYRQIGSNFIPILKDELIPAIRRGIIPLFKKMADTISNLINWVTSLSPAIKKTIGVVLGITAAIGPVLVAVGGLISLLPVLISGLTAIISPVGLVVAALAGVVAVITTQWSSIKPYILDTINWFIDLYNESMLVRIAVQKLVTEFKIGWAVISEVVKGSWDIIKSQLGPMVDAFKGLGNVIMGVLTWDWDEFKQGLSDFTNAVSDATTNRLNGLVKMAKTISEDVSREFNDGIKRITDADKIDHVLDIGIKINKTNVKSDLEDQLSGAKGSFRPKLEVVASVDMGLENNQDIFDFDGVKGQMLQLSDVITRVSEDFIEKTLRMVEVAQQSTPLIANSFAGMGDRFVDSLGMATDGLQGFLKEILSFATDTIAALLAQSMAQAITGAVTAGTATGPFGFFTTPAFIAQAIGSVTTAFAAIPKFADGGIISGPTLGLMGEYPGASRNPEVIAPLDKLRSMIGTAAPQNINVEVTGRLRGQDILLQSERARKYRDRRN